MMKYNYMKVNIEINHNMRECTVGTKKFEIITKKASILHIYIYMYMLHKLKFKSLQSQNVDLLVFLNETA